MVYVFIKNIENRLFFGQKHVFRVATGKISVLPLWRRDSKGALSRNLPENGRFSVKIGQFRSFIAQIKGIAHLLLKSREFLDWEVAHQDEVFHLLVTKKIENDHLFDQKQKSNS